MTAFQQLSASMNQRTRNRFRRPAANAPRVEALLSQGEVIQPIHEDGKAKWRTAGTVNQAAQRALNSLVQVSGHPQNAWQSFLQRMQALIR
ncbi:hypothetical protein ACI3L1_15645 [Deinococcus sp. SM5_A1]|uniref:hypothetical protein n=1 Tax=Deinococcus sp. SM5_A1 TaxID=3379094 RepID=UPI00385B8864